jgi:mannose-1-phosphate guanylyltransferase
MKYAVIMAGGSGTRFWPMSRKSRPKQLLNLWEDSTLLQSTFKRLTSFVPPQQILVVTGEHLADAIASSLPGLPPDNLLVEPCPKNTLPCLALAASTLAARDPEARMCVFPADAHIHGEEAFIGACNLADAASMSGKIATLGIPPTGPETGYGYIHCQPENDPPYPVTSFVEKPSLEKAQEYLRAGTYLWNAGIFFLSVDTLRNEMRLQQPEMARIFEQITEHLTRREKGLAASLFQDLSPVSIDYGIMERAQNVVVVPAEFTWSDVGHWAALDHVAGVDENHNVQLGDIYTVDVSDSVLVNKGNKGHLLAAVGVSGLVIVQTEDATLILPKKEAQRVKEIVDWLKENDRNDLV